VSPLISFAFTGEYILRFCESIDLRSHSIPLDISRQDGGL
jgi:hypothetical protein